MLVLVAAWGLFAVVVAVALWPRHRPAGVGLPFGNGQTRSLDGGGVLAPHGLAHLGPTGLALLFALLSLPLVGLTLGATPGETHRNDLLSATDPSRWSAAASAAFISALVAGTIGARVVRRHARVGALFTFMLALIVAIPALPLLPALLGQNVGAGFLCLGACSDVTTTTNLITGVWADLFFLFAPLYEPVPVLILALGVGLWAHLVRQLPET